MNFHERYWHDLDFESVCAFTVSSLEGTNPSENENDEALLLLQRRARTETIVKRDFVERI